MTRATPSATGGEAAAPTLCFIVAPDVAFLAKALRRRGFLVYEPWRDYPGDADPAQLAEWAEETGCVAVGTSAYLEGRGNAIRVPHPWLHRYNTWDLTTKVVKLAAEKRRER